VQYPFPTGYSNVGVVEAVGTGVASLKPGDRVASFAHHAAYIVQREEYCHPIPPAVSDRDATWFAIAGVAQNGVRSAGHALGDDVAVIGLGPIGQLAVQYVRLCGARVIIAIDPIAGRVEAAKSHGATHGLSVPVADAAPLIGELTGGRLCDVVHDVTGNDQVFVAALRLLRQRGTLSLIGDTGSPAGQRLDSAMMERSLRVIATHGTSAPKEETIWARWTRRNLITLFLDFLADGRMRVADLNTHVFAPEDCQGAYQKLLRDRATTMGCHFAWDAARA
jgi:threonine dehydrogenase-like Zn-dependent dehydrogenase